MGKILVGQKNPKAYATEGLSFTKAKPVTAEELERKYSDEEKQRIIINIMKLPKDQIVPKLRENGFHDVAEFVEQQMAEEQRERDRENRLEEILAMPEEEQLPLLLAEGFDEEAKELSEKLALQQEQTDEGSGEENQGQDLEADGGETELSVGDGETADEAPADGDGNTETVAEPGVIGDAAPEDAAPAKTEKKKTAKKTPKKK